MSRSYLFHVIAKINAATFEVNMTSFSEDIVKKQFQR